MHRHHLVSIGARESVYFHSGRRCSCSPGAHSHGRCRPRGLGDDIDIQDDHLVETEGFGRSLITRPLEDGQVFVGQADLATDCG